MAAPSPKRASFGEVMKQHHTRAPWTSPEQNLRLAGVGARDGVAQVRLNPVRGRPEGSCIPHEEGMTKQHRFDCRAHVITKHYRSRSPTAQPGFVSTHPWPRGTNARFPNTSRSDTIPRWLFHATTAAFPSRDSLSVPGIAESKQASEVVVPEFQKRSMLLSAIRACAVFLLTVAPRGPAGGTAAGGVAAAVKRVPSPRYATRKKKRKRTIRRCGTVRLHICRPAHGVAAM